MRPLAGCQSVAVTAHHGCSGRRLCLACMPTRLIDMCMYVHTYAVSLVSSDSLKPSECSGITIGTSNGCCRSLPTRPRVALRVPQVHCLWRFRRADYLRHVGALAGVSADFHALSSSSSTLQTLIAGFPSSTAICRRPHLPLVARAFR